MSKKAWEELSPGDRAIFRQVARQSAQFMRRQWETYEDQARNVAESDVKVVETFERTPFVEATKPIYDRILSDQASRDLVKKIRQVQ
jgi:TRAP-type C4-dicarboxylate transport system substrate-binding protein